MKPAVLAVNTLQVEDTGKPMERLRADVAVEGVVGNAHVLQTFGRKQLGDVDLAAAFSSMRATAGAVHGGDLKPVEAMLMAQATSLNAIYCELARRAGLNLSENLAAADTYLKLALKAQAQSRATLEALVEAKTPRSVLIAKQANVAHGPQQVNNAAGPAAVPARTKEPATSPNELLEAPKHVNRMDSGAAGAPGRADPYLEPMVEIDRAAHC
jgi:hypothetical protein